MLDKDANLEAAGSTLTVNYIATTTIARDSKTIKQSQIKQSQAKGFKVFVCLFYLYLSIYIIYLYIYYIYRYYISIYIIYIDI